MAKANQVPPKKAAPKKAAVVVVPAPKPKATKQPQVTLIDFTPDVKEILIALTAALVNHPAPVIHVQPAASGSGYAPPTPVTHSAPVPVVETPTAPKVTAQVVKPEVKQAEMFQKEEATGVNLTQIREMINAKAEAGKTEAIVSLLANFGAKNASTLAEEHFDEFYTQLNGL